MKWTDEIIDKLLVDFSIDPIDKQNKQTKCTKITTFPWLFTTFPYMTCQNLWTAMW